MPYYVYGGSSMSENPIHLNDIQPVLEDGPHWKKGDLFLSLRSPSLVMLYRPSTNKILWHRVGPWSHQHDVDILDDHRISIYNNNSAEYSGYRKAFDTVEVMIYDFDNDQITSPWHDALEKLDVRAETAGLSTILPNNELFIEEQNYGRLLHITQDGDVVWEYVNRAKMGRVFRVGWNRLLSREQGDKLAATLAKASCPN